MAPEHTTDAKVLQALVAAYNAISTGAGDTPETWCPRLAAHGDAAAAPYLWAGGFLLATERKTEPPYKFMMGHLFNQHSVTLAYLTPA